MTRLDPVRVGVIKPLAVGPASLARLIRQLAKYKTARQASAQCLTASAGSQPKR